MTVTDFVIFSTMTRILMYVIVLVCSFKTG